MSIATGYGNSRGQVRDLLAEVESLRRDAERYRWLRKHLTDAHGVFRKEDHALHSFDFDCEGDIELDAVIDAVMKGANAEVSRTA